jgi:hypothetical protein
MQARVHGCLPAPRQKGSHGGQAGDPGLAWGLANIRHQLLEELARGRAVARGRQHGLDPRTEVVPLVLLLTRRVRLALPLLPVLLLLDFAGRGRSVRWRWARDGPSPPLGVVPIAMVRAKAAPVQPMRNAAALPHTTTPPKRVLDQRHTAVLLLSLLPAAGILLFPVVSGRHHAAQAQKRVRASYRLYRCGCAKGNRMNHHVVGCVFSLERKMLIPSGRRHAAGRLNDVYPKFVLRGER